LLKRKIISCVGDARLRFKEDYLRIIRMCRFAARFDFNIAGDTGIAAYNLAPEVLKNVSPERIFAEFNKAFESDNSALFITWLDYIRLFTLIFPEYEDWDNIKQNPKYHPEITLRNHILEAVERADGAHKWHALLHDIGKKDTAQLKEGEDYSSFHGHHDKGAELIDNVAGRLKFPSDLYKSVRTTTALHMFPLDYVPHRRKDFTFPENIKRKFQAKCGDYLPDVKAVAIADLGPKRFWEVEHIFDELLPSTTIKPVLLGRHLLEVGIGPGIEMGEMLKKAFEIQLEDGIMDMETLRNLVINKELL
jgi:poly(A) polymerase/tRNA nucleotidyltransferase (CCA-adding enzyme)